MRQIPSLQVLCLRSVGGHGCNAEDTFAPSKPNTSDADGKTVASSASRLLQSFDSNDENISISRTPATGKGAARRNQANDVDLNHPWIGIWSSGDPEKREMLMEFGSSGLDVLQSYIRVEGERLGQGNIISSTCQEKGTPGREVDH
jgi:hypothetical protein